MKAVVFYESADDLAEKAPLHACRAPGRWREFADARRALMVAALRHAPRPR